MAKTKLVIAISSRALFDLTESHGVFEEKGIEEYRKYQVENEKDFSHYFNIYQSITENVTDYL